MPNTQFFWCFVKNNTYGIAISVTNKFLLIGYIFVYCVLYITVFFMPMKLHKRWEMVKWFLSTPLYRVSTPVEMKHCPTSGRYENSIYSISVRPQFRGFIVVFGEFTGHLRNGTTGMDDLKLRADINFLFLNWKWDMTWTQSIINCIL